MLLRVVKETKTQKLVCALSIFIVSGDAAGTLIIWGIKHLSPLG